MEAIRKGPTMSYERMSVSELKALLDQGEKLRLIDVRTPMEREIAAIEPSTLLDEALFETLVEDDDGTPVVLYCHHGIRSASAAAFFAHKGLQRAINLEGGIDAWSLAIAPAVERY